MDIHTHVLTVYGKHGCVKSKQLVLRDGRLYTQLELRVGATAAWADHMMLWSGLDWCLTSSRFNQQLADILGDVG